MKKQEEYWLKLMNFFAPTCHQKAERSFFCHGWQFPVCARCTGLYIGYSIGLLCLFMHIYLPYYISFIFLFLMFIDWFLQFKNIRMSTNIRRCCSGVLAGIGCVQCIGILILTIW